jgi:hypothetical protein
VPSPTRSGDFDIGTGERGEAGDILAVDRRLPRLDDGHRSLVLHVVLLAQVEIA